MAGDEEYRNPVDRKTYFAPGGWKLHEPETPRVIPPGQRVKTAQIRLLTSEAEIAVRTDVSCLASFLREAQRLADVAFGSAAGQFRVLAQFTCNPAGHEVQLAHQGDAAEELLQEYYDALLRAQKLPVQVGEVSFQLELLVNL